MKYLIYIPFIFTLIVVGACKNAEEATIKAESDSQITAHTNDQNNDEEEAEIQKDSLFASLVRTPCFGKCPVFEMYIYEGGTVILEGKHFVEMIGTYKTTITAEQKQAFVEKAEFIGFMDLEEKYDSPVTDLPSATTTIRIDGVRKEVYRRADYPRKILQLEKLFDDLLETQEWEKISE